MIFIQEAAYCENASSTTKKKTFSISSAHLLIFGGQIGGRRQRLAAAAVLAGQGNLSLIDVCVQQAHQAAILRAGRRVFQESVGGFNAVTPV